MYILKWGYTCGDLNGKITYSGSIQELYDPIKNHCHVYIIEVQSFCGQWSQGSLPSQQLQSSFPSSPRSNGPPSCTYAINECSMNISICSWFSICFPFVYSWNWSPRALTILLHFILGILSPPICLELHIAQYA